MEVTINTYNVVCHKSKGASNTKTPKTKTATGNISDAVNIMMQAIARKQ
jgi:hypothetical protein